MALNKTLIGIAAIALYAALPAAAQTTVTMEAESMALSSYAIESGNRIKLTSSTAAGTASKNFSGASGTYDMTVHVVGESDGQSTLEVYKGATRLRTYTYPRRDGATSFTISNVSLQSGEAIKLIGRPQAGALARVDKIALTPVASTTTPTATTPTATTPTTTSTPTSTTPTSTTPTRTTPIIGDALASVGPVTMEAESMALSSYAIESGNRIKLTSSTAAGTASKNFSGASGAYDMTVHVVGESDGQSTLEVYKGATRLRTYTYPLRDGATSFTISNVSLNSGEAIKLIGRPQAGALARVDKIVLSRATTPTTPSTPVATSPPPSTTACANPSGGYEGFGRNTTGGAGKPIYRVTSLNDSGTGSLRDALSQGNRCVVFDVGGTISLAGNLIVRGGNVTIDGLTAPAPGITLRNRTLVMQGSSGAGNVVVRGVRLRDTPAGEDAMRVYNASNIVVDRVSVSGFGDGAIDVTESSRDVTIQWSILGNGNPAHNYPSLIAYRTSRVTLHHNLYFSGDNRNPSCNYNGTAVPAEVVCDIRNNLIWNYAGNGTQVQHYGTANVVNNYYYTTKPMTASNTIRLGWGGQPVSAYVSGNRSQNGWNLEGLGNRSTPFAAVVPATSDALTAARQIVAQAGARGARFGLDQTDLGYIGQISLP